MAKQLNAPITEAIETIELSSGTERLSLTAADRSRLTEIRQRRLKLAASTHPPTAPQEPSPARRGCWLVAGVAILAAVLAML